MTSEPNILTSIITVNYEQSMNNIRIIQHVFKDFAHCKNEFECYIIL